MTTKEVRVLIAGGTNGVTRALAEIASLGAHVVVVDDDPRPIELEPVMPRPINIKHREPVDLPERLHITRERTHPTSPRASMRRKK